MLAKCSRMKTRSTDGWDALLSFLLLLEFTSSSISYWPPVSLQSKRMEAEVEKVIMLTLCNLLKIQEEEENE